MSACAEPGLARPGPTLGGLPSQELLLDTLPEPADGEWLATQLHPLELQRWRSMAWPKRRREWLAGRLCAKSALRPWLNAAEAAPDRLLIGRDALARPCLPGTGLHLSISHSRRRAMAVADRAPLGLDTELHEAVRAQSMDLLIPAEETALTAQQLGLSEREARTVLWCLKEARFKCQGQGSFVSLAQGWRLDGWSADAQPRWHSQAAWPPAPPGRHWRVSLHINEHEACALVHTQPGAAPQEECTHAC